MIRPIAIAAILALSVIATGCPKDRPDETSPAYRAACEGPPLRTVERRNQAMEDGYGINRQYDCIDKASYVAVVEERAKWQAARTPEAIAQRKAEWDKKAAEARASREVSARQRDSIAAPASVVLQPVDVNTATESELASVISIGPDVATQIVEERNKGRFKDWADLVRRVAPLGAAQSAVFASVCGLNVDGQSLPGAPPDPAMAASIQSRYRKN